jgi:spermidine/putrescine transport system ATP-binding protein
MNQGEFEQIGTPQDLYHHPKTAFVAGFVGDSNRWSGIVKASDATGGKVETEQGLPMSFSSAGGQAIQEGSKVTVFVRPEFIRTVRAGETGLNANAGENRMDGIVDSLLFNGANSRVLVRTGSGELVETDVTLTGDNDLKPGEDVHLVWSSKQSMCFADQGSA